MVSHQQNIHNYTHFFFLPAVAVSANAVVVVFRFHGTDVHMLCRFLAIRIIMIKLLISDSIKYAEHNIVGMSRKRF